MLYHYGDKYLSMVLLFFAYVDSFIDFLEIVAYSLSYIVISKYDLVTVKKQTVFFSKSIIQHINTFSVYDLTFHLFPFYL